MNQPDILYRKAEGGDVDALVAYFSRFSAATIKRFGPHSFDREALELILEDRGTYSPFVAIDSRTGEIIGYAIVKHGYLEHDQQRLQAYGLSLDHGTDCTYAPSVADDYQGKGIGSELFRLVLEETRKLGFRRIILWGGVQSDNTRAVNYYRKLGFVTLGQFEYYGWNYDMILT